MSKNNFFVKFAYYYKCRITGIPEMAEYVKDQAVDLFEPLVLFIIGIIGFLFRITHIFFPILSLILCFTSRYVDKAEIEEWGVSNPKYLKSGYYTFRDIKKFKERIKKELEAEK